MLNTKNEIFINMVSKMDESLINNYADIQIDKKYLFKSIDIIIKSQIYNKIHQKLWKFIWKKLNNFNIIVKKNKTVLMFFIEKREIGFVQLILKNGADINKNLFKNLVWNSYFKKNINEDLDILKLLINNNLNILELDKNNDSPLLLAIKFNYIKSFELLLPLSINIINHANNKGNTAAHICCINNNLLIFNKLLENNVNINIANNDGKLPIFYTNNKSIIKLIEINNILTINENNYNKLFLQEKDVKSKNLDVEKYFHKYLISYNQYIETFKYLCKKKDKELITKIKKEIKKINKNYEIMIFGSYGTNLDLPSSDIDICIKNVENSKDILICLYNIFNNLGFQSNLILNTKIPVLKLQANIEYNNRSIDITIFNKDHKGNHAIDLVNKYLKDHKILKLIILLMKDILRINHLNTSFKGGLNSYSIIWIIVSYLQFYEYSYKENYNKTSFYFFFDLIKFIISFNNDKYILKPNKERNFEYNPILEKSKSEFAYDNLVCIDPLNIENNITKSCFRFDEIKMFLIKIHHYLTLSINKKTH